MARRSPHAHSGTERGFAVRGRTALQEARRRQQSSLLPNHILRVARKEIRCLADRGAYCGNGTNLSAQEAALTAEGLPVMVASVPAGIWRLLPPGP